KSCGRNSSGEYQVLIQLWKLVPQRTWSGPLSRGVKPAKANRRDPSSRTHAQVRHAALATLLNTWSGCRVTPGSSIIVACVLVSPIIVSGLACFFGWLLFHRYGRASPDSNTGHVGR